MHHIEYEGLVCPVVDQDIRKSVNDEAERKIEYWTKKILGKTKSWHAVRHTYISLSRELELPMEVVMANTGDTAATILKYYSRPSGEYMRQSVEDHKLFEVQ